MYWDRDKKTEEYSSVLAQNDSPPGPACLAAAVNDQTADRSLSTVFVFMSLTGSTVGSSPILDEAGDNRGRIPSVAHVALYRDLMRLSSWLMSTSSPIDAFL